MLKRQGRLTILSDNGRYCRALCATLGALRDPTGATARAALVNEDIRLLDGAEAPYHEMVSGVRLYYGTPGPDCGHLVTQTSYFDRLWEYRQGEATERFYIFMKKAM